MSVEGVGVAVTHTFPQPVTEVFALLTDVGKMAGLGPEHTAASWDTSARGVGATFHGTNRRGDHTWTVPCLVTEYVEPTRFTWTGGDPGEPFATWSYDLRPTGTGTTVVHTFTHGPGESGITAAIRSFPEREREIIEGRCAELAENMRTSLGGAAQLLAS